MKIQFVINRKSKMYPAIIPKLKTHFEELGKIDFSITDYPGHAIQLSHENRHVDVMVAVGGDGHINEVINGIFFEDLKTINDSNYFNSEMIQNTQKPLFAFLPAGSGNDFARSFDFTNSIPALKKRILSEKVQLVDLGLIRFHSFEGETRYRLFNNVTDVGVGAFVLQNYHHLPSWLNPNVGYFWAVLKTLSTFRYRKMLVRTEKFMWDDLSTSIVVANGTYFGSGIGIAPQATPTDGMFGLTILGKVGPKEFLFNISELKNGKPITHPEIIYEKAERVLIDAHSEELPVQMDGELIGKTPVEFVILPKKLKMLI